jgi:formyltetrahydrofolate-dependent phosphoribosylglycinamide formyltransferase
MKVAVLISGSGTTLQNLIDRKADLGIELPLVISSRPGVGGLDRAGKAKIQSAVIERRNFDTHADFSRAVFDRLDAARPDLVCLGGWLSLLEIPKTYAGRVMNIHPSLLPSFGGRGMFGRHVHQAVIDRGCKVSGCTVHFVDDGYDSGPIILQRTCPVLDGDTAATLAARVFEQEKIAYPEAIGLFKRGKLRIEGRNVTTR